MEALLRSNQPQVDVTMIAPVVRALIHGLHTHPKGHRTLDRQLQPLTCSLWPPVPPSRPSFPPLVHLSIRPFVHSSIRPFVHLSIRPFVHLSICPFVHLSNCPFPFVHSSIRPFVHVSLPPLFLACDLLHRSQLCLLSMLTRFLA